MRTGQIIVVGGGLAGAAFALETARGGARVLVLERTRDSHHKVCGEFLSLEAQQLLAYLGLDVGRMGASTIGTLRLVSAEHALSAPLPFRGSGLSRHRLDQALLEAAGAAGAEISRGCHVTGLEPDREAVAVHVDGRTLRGDQVALATGKHNLRGHPRSAGSMVAMKIQLVPSPAAGAEIEGYVQLTGYDGGYVGVCHVEDGLLTMCWLMTEALLKRIGAKWPAHADYLAGVSPFLADIIAGSRPAWEPAVSVAGLPYGFLRKDVISPRVYPLGDQLAVIPSYTGDGTAIALSSGIAAAQAVLAGKGAESFQSGRIALLRPQFRIASAVNVLFETALRRRLGLALAASLPGMVPMIIRTTRLRGHEDLIRGSSRSAPPRLPRT